MVQASAAHSRCYKVEPAMGRRRRFEAEAGWTTATEDPIRASPVVVRFSGHRQISSEIGATVPGKPAGESGASRDYLIRPATEPVR